MNAACTSMLHSLFKVLTQWFWNDDTYSDSRKRVISLVPPITRQSTCTVRPVRARHHCAKPWAYSNRIASLCGVMITIVSSALPIVVCLVRKANGSATTATRARMMSARFIGGNAGQEVSTMTSSGATAA